MNCDDVKNDASVKKEIITAEDVLSPVNGEAGRVSLDCLTEATSKFEAPKAREGRERKELADQAHRHRVEMMKTRLAAALLLGFFALGIYLFAFKRDVTEVQKTGAMVILTAIASGGGGYAFGKKTGDKSGEG